MESQHSFFTGFYVLWAVINNIEFLHRQAMKHVYTSQATSSLTPARYCPAYDYITMESYFNRSYYTQVLPPVPPNCPTPMGVAGNNVVKIPQISLSQHCNSLLFVSTVFSQGWIKSNGPVHLPPAQDVFEQLLARTEFKICPFGTNLLFVAYAQHFIHQFIKTDFKSGIDFIWDEKGIDSSQIYGKDEWTRHALRCFRGGKLTMRVINDEDYPPYLDDVPDIDMWYPPGDTPETMWNNPKKEGRNVSLKWALGHPHFSSNPWVFVIATIWIREHNRVCEILQMENPNWDDEQLYQTARLIITGEMMHITIQDYLQHMSQYNLRLTYEPQLLHETSRLYSNRIHQELGFMYQLHSMLPDRITLASKIYNIDRYYFSDNKIITDNGLKAAVTAMINTIAGEHTHQNFPRNIEFWAKWILEWSRTARIQSFNNYRKAFGMQPYKSFLDLTGNPEAAKILKNLYKDVDAVEFFVGMLVEKKDSSLVGPTMASLGRAWIIQDIMAHVIGSPSWWKPSTFGGSVGMDIIKQSSLETLICNNMKNGCSGMNISFTVPLHVLKEVLTQFQERNRKHRPPDRRCGVRYSRIL
ncbi:prostaglandin G/H synthase 2-like [Periplaneta americana]|uniref:prostaglandin G/H synthase 2-like n=1 Tax=Periplaneta americana TaxID=6978 RepID=UPI0037E78D0E